MLTVVLKNVCVRVTCSITGVVFVSLLNKCRITVDWYVVLTKLSV